MIDRDSSVTEEELHAFVDGELPADRQEAVAAWLAAHDDDATTVAAWRSQADKLLDGLLPIANENLFMHLALLNALDLRLRAAEIVVVGSGEQAHELIALALKAPFLDRVVLHAPSAQALPNQHPAQDKIKTTRDVAAFVCVGETCSLPVTSPEQLSQALAAMRPHAAAS